MRAMFSLIGGSLGWYLGAYLGIFAALLLSAVGTGLGVYYARKLVES